MLKLLPLICVLTLLISCSRNSKEDANTADSVKVIPATEPVENYQFKGKQLLAYEHFLNQLDQADADNTAVATSKFHSLFDGLDKATCDSAFYLFENFYSNITNKIDELHSSDTTNYDSLVLVFDGPEEIKLSSKLSNYNLKLQKNGFRISMTEGTTYIQEDRDFVAKNFYKNLSHLMATYLEQLNKENKEGYWEDGGLVIESITLVDRIIWWETFNTRNPDFIFKKIPYRRQRNYTTSLITGEDNTPLFYEEGGPLDGYFKTAYDYLLDRYPSSATAKLLKPYYGLLLKSDTAAIRRFRELNLK